MSTADAATLVAAAFGAFLGTGSAFLLEQSRRRRAEDDTRYTSLLKAELALGMQLNDLVNTQRQYLDEHRDHPQRCLRLVPLVMGMTDLRVDLGSLAFVAEVDDVQILQLVYLAELGYVTAITTLAANNNKIEEIRYQEATRLGPVDMTTGEAVAMIDAARYQVLKETTDGLYDSVDGEVEQHKKALSELHALCKRLFPKRRSLQFEVAVDAETPS
jgi:hypothetical protein